MKQLTWKQWIVSFGVILVAALGLAAAGYARSASAAELKAAASLRWNAISIPLDISATATDAQSLADSIPGTQNILRWNPDAQAYNFYVPDPIIAGGYGDDANYPNGNFPIAVGDALFVLLDSSADSGLYFVGAVPPQTGQAGAVQFNLIGGANCVWNYISIPLDQNQITDAQSLADSISDIQNILVWNPSGQAFNFYVPDPVASGGTGDNPNYTNGNFPVKLGYPYWLCMSAAKNWP